MFWCFFLSAWVNCSSISTAQKYMVVYNTKIFQGPVVMDWAFKWWCFSILGIALLQKIGAFWNSIKFTKQGSCFHHFKLNIDFWSHNGRRKVDYHVGLQGCLIDVVGLDRIGTLHFTTLSFWRRTAPFKRTVTGVASNMTAKTHELNLYFTIHVATKLYRNGKLQKVVVFFLRPAANSDLGMKKNATKSIWTRPLIWQKFCTFQTSRWGTSNVPKPYVSLL